MLYPHLKAGTQTNVQVHHNFSVACTIVKWNPSGRRGVVAIDGAEYAVGYNWDTEVGIMMNEADAKRYKDSIGWKP